MCVVELLAGVSGRNARAKTGRYLARERVYCLAGTCHTMVKASTLHLHAVEESACRALRACSLIGEEGTGGGGGDLAGFQTGWSKRSVDHYVWPSGVSTHSGRWLGEVWITEWQTKKRKNKTIAF